ncbi:MAG: hypothetical protein O3A90_16650 [Proteobacteria bacterium]|nr:hypothetical protein [Pseudomonadota bacterium]MDA1294950.1 hypothetical protein [Pseudomonadota bacterium]
MTGHYVRLRVRDAGQWEGPGGICKAPLLVLAAMRPPKHNRLGLPTPPGPDLPPPSPREIHHETSIVADGIHGPPPKVLPGIPCR